MLKSFFLSILKPWLKNFFNFPKKIEESQYKLSLKDVIISFACVFSLFTVAWIISIFTQDITLVDFCWGFGLAIQSFYYFIQSIKYTGKISYPKFIFSALQFINGVRLGVYLIVRSHNKPEDKRYAFIRNKIGRYFWILSYFLLFFPQICVNTTLDLTLYEFNNVNNHPINKILYTIGIFLMCSGTLFQTISDYQLYKFKTNKINKGKIFHEGLWRFSRHPNYFGDTVNWWGIFLCNASVGIYRTVLCPIIFTLGIMFIHGVPTLEYFMKKDYGKSFENYKKNVSAFVPNIFNTTKYQDDCTVDVDVMKKKNKKKERKKYNNIQKFSNYVRNQNKSVSNVCNHKEKKNKFTIKNRNQKNYHRVQ